MTTREQLEQEAEKRAVALNDPDIGYEYGYEAGFIAGRTISEAEADEAGVAIHREYDPYTPFENLDSSEQMSYYRQARAALEAAGLVIEE